LNIETLGTDAAVSGTSGTESAEIDAAGPPAPRAPRHGACGDRLPPRSGRDVPTVLYVHHRPELGGAPTSLYQLLKALDRERYRPVVLCPGGDAAELFASAGVPVHEAPIAVFSHVVTCTYHGLRWAMLAREAVRALPHARAIAHRIRAERAAVVHLNEGNLLLAALVARLTGVRVVCHFRGMLAEGHFGLRRRLVRACLARWSDAVVAIDGGVAAPLSGLPNLRIVHNSVDLGLFGRADGAAVRRELGLPSTAPVAGMVGRVRRDEGSFEFLHAAARLQTRLPEARFLLVGGGTRSPAFFRTARGRLLLATGIIHDELAEAGALAARLGLTNVQFVPFRRDVAAVYAALDVVVTGGEAGIGRQALEAAAAGRPIVAASRQLVPDLVAESETGFLVPPGDPVALATCLHRLLAEPERRQAVGAAARTLAANRFDPAANAARIMAIYDQLLGA
jgi:glycosyltransferase involved in cell wall biosynthesis